MASLDPFITAQDLSDHLGRDVSADSGAVMAIDAACDVIRDYTDQDFNLATTTLPLDGTGTDALVLPQSPAIAAGTVVLNGGTITDYMLNPRTNALIRGSAGSRYHYSPVWPFGRQNVVVTYDHGYAVTPTNNVPRSIRIVALMVAERLVIQGVVQSETIGDVTVDYGMAATDLTDGEKAILYGYAHRQSP